MNQIQVDKRGPREERAYGVDQGDPDELMVVYYELKAEAARARILLQDITKGIGLLDEMADSGYQTSISDMWRNWE
jgi:hypothetical protein